MLNSNDANVPASDGDTGHLPRHVAIIMDGNGRWAKHRSLSRADGHQQGVESVRRTVRWAGELGIEYLTLFSFSSENWNRPAAEVRCLLGLLKRFIHQDLAELHQNNICVRIIGRRDNLEKDLANLLEESEHLTSKNTGMTLVIAFNYGGQDEIARAVRKILEDCRAGTCSPEDISPALIDRYLDTADIPDPDLIIRTSGEQRLSNFLLWQCAYAEFVFMPQHWPEFTADMLHDAVRQFQSRDRRYGGLAATAAP